MGGECQRGAYSFEESSILLQSAAKAEDRASAIAAIHHLLIYVWLDHVADTTVADSSFGVGDEFKDGVPQGANQ